MCIDARFSTFNTPPFEGVTELCQTCSGVCECIYLGITRKLTPVGRGKKKKETMRRGKGKRVLGGQTTGRAHAVCIGATGTQGKCGQKAVSREARDEQPDDRTVSRSSWRALRTIRLMSTTLSTT